MKKKLFIACLLFVATMLTGCSGSQTVIKSADGSQKVDLTGTWVAKKGNTTFKMIFGSDGSFTYGCGGGSHGGPAQLSVGSDGDISVDKEFNKWCLKGTYKTSGNILTSTVKEKKEYNVSSGMPGAGGTQNFIINIVSENELVIQTSGTGNTRTYERQ